MGIVPGLKGDLTIAGNRFLDPRFTPSISVVELKPRSDSQTPGAALTTQFALIRIKLDWTVHGLT